jgi:hypothetical protein
VAEEVPYNGIGVYEMTSRIELFHRADPSQLRQMRLWLTSPDRDGTFMVYVIRGGRAGEPPYEHTAFAFSSPWTAADFEDQFVS